jgi:hypothetical protein
MSDLQERIAALEVQLAELKAQVGAESTEVLASRREFARKAALSVAGLAVAGVAGAVATAGPAAAADLDSLLIGEDNTQGTGSLGTITSLRYINPAVPTAGVGAGDIFTVRDSLSVPTAAESTYPAAISGSVERIFPHGVSGVSVVANGYGTIGLGSGQATGVLARGSTRANLELFSEGASGPGRAGTHNKGEIVNDANGDVWLCVTAGNPGGWRKLGGPSTSGQLHLVTPGRVYDSRDALIKHAFGAADRVVTVTTVAVGHIGAGNVLVPTGATGILCNLTVTETEGAGFLGLYSNALATWPGNSSINWVAVDTDIANSVTTAIDANGRIKVNIGGSSVAAKTHFVIDVVGYYL